MIECDNERCETWHHIECVGLSDEITKRIDKFYCPRCLRRYRLLSTWKSARDPSDEELAIKEKEYFEVEKILDVVEYTDGERDFLVKWKGFGPEYNLYIPESGMDGCLNLLQEFCRSRRIRFSNIVGLIGATNDEMMDKRNWVSADDIIRADNGFKEKRHTLSLELYEGELGNRDRLFLYVLDHHAYIIMYYADQNMGYIADGRNAYKTVYFRNVIKCDLKIRLVHLGFEQQNHEGFCGSSAAAIALYMMNCYETGHWKNEVTIGPTRLKRIASRLHKLDAKPLETSREKGFRGTFNRCKHCQKVFKGGKKMRTLTQHEKHCAGRK